MANNNYNLRGLQLEIQNYNASGGESGSHYHYFFFADFTPQIAFDFESGINWNLNRSDENNPFFEGNINSGYNFPEASQTGAFVRTYLIGSFVVPENLNNYRPFSESQGLRLIDNGGNLLALGNPSSRRPPIIKFDSLDLRSLGGIYGYGVTSQLRGPTTNGTFPDTLHSQPDYFVVGLGSVDPPYNNILSLSVSSDNKVVGNANQPRNNPSKPGKVTAAGALDCNVNPLPSTKTDNLPPLIPTKFYIIAGSEQSVETSISWLEL